MCSCFCITVPLFFSHGFLRLRRVRMLYEPYAVCLLDDLSQCMRRDKAQERLFVPGVISATETGDVKRDGQRRGECRCDLATELCSGARRGVWPRRSRGGHRGVRGGYSTFFFFG